jgi:hypothetical protein
MEPTETHFHKLLIDQQSEASPNHGSANAH